LTRKHHNVLASPSTVARSVKWHNAEVDPCRENTRSSEAMRGGESSAPAAKDTIQTARYDETYEERTASPQKRERREANMTREAEKRAGRCAGRERAPGEQTVR